MAVLLSIDLAEQNRVGRVTHVDNMQTAPAFAPKVADAVDDYHVLKSPAYGRTVMTGQLRVGSIGTVNDHHAVTVVRSQVSVLALAPDIAVSVFALEGIEPAE